MSKDNHNIIGKHNEGTTKEQTIVNVQNQLFPNFYIRREEKEELGQGLRFTRPIPEKKLKKINISLNLINNTWHQLIDFMLIHTNQVTNSHLPRMLYMQKFNKSSKSQYLDKWPFFISSVCQLFEIRFFIKFQEKYIPYQMSQPIKIKIKQLIKQSDKKDKFNLIIQIKQIISEGEPQFEISFQQIDKQKFPGNIIQKDSVMKREKHALKSELSQQAKQYLRRQCPQLNFKENLSYLAAYEPMLYAQMRNQRKSDEQTDKKRKKDELNLLSSYIKQGMTGDCYLIASLEQIILKADYILDLLWVFVFESKDKKQRKGCCVLNIDGMRIPVLINLSSIQKQKKEYVARISNQTKNIRLTQLIKKAILVEQALAKVFRKYSNLNKGRPQEALMMLTNFNSKHYCPDASKCYWKYLQQWQKQYNQRFDSKKFMDENQTSVTQTGSNACLVIASIYKQQQAKSQWSKKFCSLFGNHALSFRGYKQIKNQERQFKDNILLIFADLRGTQNVQKFRKYQKSQSDYIDREQNEIIVTLRQFSELPGTLDVCINRRIQKKDEKQHEIFEPYSYLSWPIVLKRQQSKRYRIKSSNKEDKQVQCQTTLHYLNKRFHQNIIGYDIQALQGSIGSVCCGFKQQQQLKKWIYPRPIYELKRTVGSRSYYQYFWPSIQSRQKHFFSLNHKYDFRGQQYQLRIGIGLNEPQMQTLPYFLYMSMMRESHHVQFQQIYQKENCSRYIPRKLQLAIEEELTADHPVAYLLYELQKKEQTAIYSKIDLIFVCEISIIKGYVDNHSELDGLINIIFHVADITQVRGQQNEKNIYKNYKHIAEPSNSKKIDQFQLWIAIPVQQSSQRQHMLRLQLDRKHKIVQKFNNNNFIVQLKIVKAHSVEKKQEQKSNQKKMSNQKYQEQILASKIQPPSDILEKRERQYIVFKDIPYNQQNLSQYIGDEYEQKEGKTPIVYQRPKEEEEQSNLQK